MTNIEFSRIFRKAINDSGIQVRELSRKSGVAEETLRRWMHGNASPTLACMSDALKVLGYEVYVVKKCQQ